MQIRVLESLGDEEFEMVFFRFCSIIVFQEKKKMSVSSAFVFLLRHPQFLEMLVGETHSPNDIYVIRRILRLYPALTKSKVIHANALKYAHSQSKNNSHSGNGASVQRLAGRNGKA